MRPLQDTQNKFPRSIWGVSSFYNIQLARNNWKIKGIFSGLVTRRLYFLKKYDAKQPNFPSCRNWPICGHLYNEIRIPFSWPWPYELPIGGDVRVESWTVNPFGSYWTLFNYLTWLSFIVVFNVPRMRNENDNDCSPSSIEINSVTARGPVFPFHICGQTQHKASLKEKD